MAVAEREAAEAVEQPQAPPAIHLSTADGDSQPLQLESLCMHCHKTGSTTMLLVDIPHFKELLIASFECPECGFRNREVQFAGAFRERGTRHTLKVAKGQQELLRRQVVKSNTATVVVLELQFEIPPGTQKGVITTVEGLLSEASSGLRQLQDERRAVDPATADAIEAVLDQLDACAAAERDFTLTVDDPAGCSHVEPGGGPGADDALALSAYERSAEQSEALGLSAGADANAADADAAEERDADAAQPSGLGQVPEGADVKDWDVHHSREAAPLGAPALQRFGGGGGIRAQGDAAAALLSHLGPSAEAPDEVVELPGHCFACGAECHTRMFPTAIPHFKDIIIMSNSCDACGYRDSEIKPGGGFSDKGRSITLQVKEREDLSRDVIKSDTAEVVIPEVDLHITTGSLGGLITTVEGLATSVQESFKRMSNFSLGDSADPEQRSRYTDFFARLDKFARLEEPWTVTLRDPLANSFIASLTSDPAEDTRLSIEDFERSAEDDADFGIDHLKLHDGQGAIE